MWIAKLTTLASGHAPALVSALLHSLWQGALLAAVCKVALLIVPCRRPNWRYAITLAGLAMVVVLFLVTLRLGARQPSPPVVSQAPLAAVSSGQVVGTEAPPTNMPPAALISLAEWSTTPPPATPTWPTALGSLWLVGVLIMLLRAVRILHGERHTVGTGQPVTDPQSIALLDQLRARFRVTRRVLLATVDAAFSPAVVGVVSPVILVPTAILTGSSPDHLRAILAHELAHIRRWDVLINVLQLLVESLFFHNPFVWLLSAQIRHEREACCDAVAADCCGGAPAYARVLVDVGQRVLAANPAIAFAHPNGLSDRVRRLLGLRPTRDTWRLPMLSLIIALLAGTSTILIVAQGTIKATDAILSATERIDLIEETVVEQKRANKPVRLGSTSYVGQVITADGSLLPQDTRLFVKTTQPQSGLYAEFSPNPKTGRFDVPATGTSAMLWLWAGGYTPWFKGPMVPGPERVTDTGVWVLEPQTPLVIRVLDDKGQPVPKAKVSAAWNPGLRQYFGHRMEDTDIAGECIAPLVTEHPMSVSVEAPGFEPAEFKDLNPIADEPLVLRLAPSLPVVLSVFDARTDAPVAGARIRMLAWFQLDTDRTYSLDDAPTLGTTAVGSVHTIPNLHRERLYWLLVEADGHGTELIERIAPGERRDVRLGPPRIVTGTITGDLNRLVKYAKRPSVQINYRIRRAGRVYSPYGGFVPVVVEDGVGTFRIDTLWSGRFYINAKHSTVRLSTESGSANVVLSLSQPQEAREEAREIRLAFTTKPGAPLPRGTMRVVGGHRTHMPTSSMTYRW